MYIPKILAYKGVLVIDNNELIKKLDKVLRPGLILKSLMNIKISKVEHRLFHIPFSNPLSFGKQKVESLNRLRVSLLLTDTYSVNNETGWGEVPLNYPWFWPNCPHADPEIVLNDIISELNGLWSSVDAVNHPMVTSYDIQQHSLVQLYIKLSRRWYSLPFLALQVINSAYDMALYDGFAKLKSMTVYELFSSDMLPVPLDYFFREDREIASLMRGITLESLLKQPPRQLAVWHMVGILDPIYSEESTDLKDWITQGGISMLKIKLTANIQYDLKRLKEIFTQSHPLGVQKYSIDYNGPDKELSWLSEFLEQLETEMPELYQRLSYIEQPLSAGFTGKKEDIASITCRKDLLVDEGAGNWKELYEYYRAGWSGVALKICKSQTSSLLMFALSRVLEKKVTVMDLTNPALAQIAHVQLAAYLSDDGELESNGIQYCPEASLIEASVHPGLFTRKDGVLDLSSINGTGYGFRINEMQQQYEGEQR